MSVGTCCSVAVDFLAKNIAVAARYRAPTIKPIIIKIIYSPLVFFVYNGSNRPLVGLIALLAVFLISLRGFMFHFLVSHWNIAIPIAVAILNIIALIAIIFAMRASDRAFRAIESVSSSRLSRNSSCSRCLSSASISGHGRPIPLQISFCFSNSSLESEEYQCNIELSFANN
jgi:hypothetical protein